ncbi:hypothetical protein [Nonomuraea candida]|nr:hypothetical protein [Nonomuraea candida]
MAGKHSKVESAVPAKAGKPKAKDVEVPHDDAEGHRSHRARYGASEES